VVVARQDAEARRPKIPVNEKVGGDQTEANINERPTAEVQRLG